jgi:DNA-binding MarR family transcriptional regulator
MHAVTFAVNRTKWKFQFFYDDILRFIGLTDARLRLMQVIDASEAPCQAELAAKLGISRQTVNETLGALIRKGLIEKKPSVVDKRKRIIALNAAGKKLLARVWAIYLRSGIANRAAARTLIDVPKKPEKIPQVIALSATRASRSSSSPPTDRDSPTRKRSTTARRSWARIEPSSTPSSNIAASASCTCPSTT